MFIVMDFLFELFESLQVEFYSVLKGMEQSVKSSTGLFVVSGLRHAKILALSFKESYRMDRLHSVDELQTATVYNTLSVNLTPVPIRRYYERFYR